MKKIVLTILFTIISNLQEINSREAFVVIENNYSNTSDNPNIDRYNPFLKDSNYSKTHLVKEGDSLSGIINKYYKNSGLNMRIVEISIIEMNKKAFVRNNPNYLFAGTKLRIPSINEMMNLVKSTGTRNNHKVNQNHIYFFGGN